MIHCCGNFVVKVKERCGSLPPQTLCGLEAFLSEGARDFTWVLKEVLVQLRGLEGFFSEGAKDFTWVLKEVLEVPDIYLPASVKSKDHAKSTHNICLLVMELSSLVVTHLLDFRVQIFNNCWLLIILKNTNSHWALHCSQAAQVLRL